MNRIPDSRLMQTACCLVVLCLSGCGRGTFRANNGDVPSRYRIKTEHVVLHSDVKLDENHELVANLKELRGRIAQTLELEPGSKKIEVYLFKDEDSYQRFLANHYPGLPPRRAYFVGTSSNLSVYTVWSDRMLEDVRHEFTHGVLH